MPRNGQNITYFTAQIFLFHMYIIIFLVFIIVTVIWVISTFNGLVRLRNRRENAFADIDVQLRQRHDLVPQLVETVKGYSSHEKDILIRVTEARSAAMSAKTVDDKIVAEQQLTNVLAGLRVQIEAYPELKANVNFMRLQEEIVEAYELKPAYLYRAMSDYASVTMAQAFRQRIWGGFSNHFSLPVSAREAPDLACISCSTWSPACLVAGLASAAITAKVPSLSLTCR